MMSLASIFRDDRGVALPMALIVLVALTTLMLAFAVLSQTEPVIAHNQMRVAQARTHAEAGFERAVWALSQGVIAPGTTDSLAAPLPDPTPAPYDGSVLVVNGNTGGYLVSVTTPDPVGSPNQRRITSTGWTPTNSVADTRTKAHRRIQATVERLPAFAFNTPCALCVKGDLGVGGNALVDATTDLSCGAKKGSITAGQTDINGSASIKGADGNNIANQTGSDFLQNQTDPNLFNGITLDAGNFKMLRELAKKNGTYFGPGYPNGTAAGSPAYTGGVTFNSANKVKNGIVFVDTVSGADIPTDQSLQNPSDFASLSINGNPFVSGTFAGWIIVNGSLSISGNMAINGLVYAVNDLTYNGTGTGEIRGLAISQNVRDTTATAISSDDSTTTGNSRIRFNCANLTPPPGAPIGFALVPGTYRELSD
jgi:Tfp pilus assembly protein PilX